MFVKTVRSRDEQVRWGIGKIRKTFDTNYVDIVEYMKDLR